jgi:hypothetical protein
MSSASPRFSQHPNLNDLLVCLQQLGTGPPFRGAASQSQRRCSHLATWPTLDSERRAAASLSTRRVAGANGVSITLDASLTQ